MSRTNQKKGQPPKNSNRGGKPNGRGFKVDKLKAIPDGRGNKSQREDEEIIDTAGRAMKSRKNDVSWYTDKFPTFAKDAATLPFAQPLGSIVELTTDGNDPIATPGVMAIHFYPTIGVSNDWTSPINRSSIRFWTYLRSIQKASGPYDHQDITMMVLAIDSCIMFHSLMRRIYGLVNAFTPINEYYPRGLMLANGISFDDIRANLQDFRAYINSFAYNLGQYVLPADIDLFDRHRWMCEGLYVDSSAAKAQTYMFVPRGFWKYDNTVSTGSQLTYVDWIGSAASPTLHTFSAIKSFGDNLINAISNEQDFTYISGDMHAFYGDKVFRVDYTEEMFRVIPSYNETVLSQIENCMIAGTWASNYTPKITQNPQLNAGAIVFQPELNFPSMMGTVKSIMNFHWDSPTPDQVLEATRLMFLPSRTLSHTIVSCGTEIVCAAWIWQINPATGAFRANPITSSTMSVTAASSDATQFTITAQNFQNLTLIGEFDWAPMIRTWKQITTASGDDQYIEPNIVADLDNWSVVNDDYLTNIHTAVLYNLFNIG